MRRFIGYELTEEEASGRIAGMRVGTPAEATLGPVAAAIPARRVAFSFTAIDGPYDGIAWVLARGEIECEFVTRHRTGASPRAVALLDELSRRVRVVPTVAQMQAAAATRFRPDSVKAWLELALANQTAGATKEARSAFARATALLVQEPSFAGRVHVGTARFELSFGGNVDAALRAAEAAVAAAPDDPDASVVLLDSLVAEHDLARAAGVLAVARGRFPDDARIQAWVLPQAAAP